MDNKKWTVIAVVIIIVAAAGAWYVLNNDGSDDSGSEGTVTDMLGRQVEIPDGVDSIVCLSAGSVRLACYMGAYDMIVGIDNMDSGSTGSPANYYMATYRIAYDIDSITNVGSEENYRAIIETGADVIFTSITEASDVDTLQENTGIPVVAISAAGNIDVDDAEFDSNVALMGEVLGKQDRANELISAKNALLEELRGYEADSSINADCYVGGMFYMMEGGFLRTTGNYASFDYTNANNVMPDTNNGNPYDTTARELAESGAEYIFVDVMTYSSSQSTFSEYRSVLQELPAVADGNMYSTMVFKYYGTNWEAELINAYYIGSVIDPETYDFDLEEKINQILDVFFPGSSIDYGSLVQYQQHSFEQLSW